MDKYFPLHIQLSGRLCIVVGGGEVALRKVHTLLSAKAEILVVAKKIKASGLYLLAEKKQIRIKEEKFKMAFCKKAFLVIAATNNKKLNRRLSKKLHAKGKLVNTADRPGPVLFPAVYDSGQSMFSVSTNGISPGLSAFLRDQIAAMLPSNWEEVLSLLKQMRKKAKKCIADKKQRRYFLLELFGLEWGKPVWDMKRIDEAAQKKLNFLFDKK